MGIVLIVKFLTMVPVWTNNVVYKQWLLSLWISEDHKLPDLFTPVTLLEFAVNNVGMADVLVKMVDEHNVYLIDLEFLSDYEHKPGITCKTGGRIYLHKQNNLLVIDRVSYGQFSYTKEDVPSNVAAAVLLGLVSYTTVCSHAIHIHLNHAVVSLTTHNSLSLDHTIRQLLLPLEFGSLLTLARAGHILLGEDSILVDIFPFTFTGLQTMTDQYVATRRVPDELHCGNMMSQDLLQWWCFLRENVNKIVTALYMSDETIDEPLIHWYAQVRLIWPRPAHEPDDSMPSLENISEMIAYIFMMHVYHVTLSNNNLTHVIRHMNLLEPTHLKNSFLFLLNFHVTDQDLPPISESMAHSITDPRIRLLVQDFYKQFVHVHTNQMTFGSIACY
jgi:hypothetical protein